MATADLLALPPKQVLDEVLQPACVAAVRGVLAPAAPVGWRAVGDGPRGEVDVDGEQVAAALGGRQLNGCPAALVAWRERRTATRLPWLENLARFYAAGTWGVDESPARDACVEAALRAETVRLAARHGIADGERLCGCRGSDVTTASRSGARSV